MTEINEDRRKRHGPEPVDDPRNHCVSSRLNSAELKKLDAQRGTMKRGEYLRCAALDVLPQTIPAINLEAWAALSRAAGNLNQIAKAQNIDPASKSWQEIVQVLKEFRGALIGAKLDEGSTKNQEG